MMRKKKTSSHRIQGQNLDVYDGIEAALSRSASQMRNTLIVVRTTCEREKSGSAIIDKLFCKCKDDDLLNRRKSSPEGRLPASRDLGFPCVTFKRLVGTKI